MTQTAKNYAQALFELHVDAESVKTTEEILKTVPEVGRRLLGLHCRMQAR